MAEESSNEYWIKKDPDALATEAMLRCAGWRQYFATSGMAEKSAKGHRYYYGMNDMLEQASRLQVGGDKGQFLKVVVNRVRSIVQRSLAMLSSRTPVMQPIAANSDADAREQAISSKGILEHVHREHDTDALDDEVLEIAMAMGEGFRLILWDANKGEETAVDEDEEGNKFPVDWAGDFANYALTPFDVARDPSIKAWRNVNWVIVRTYESKFELAAEHTDKADEILALAPEVIPQDGVGIEARPFGAAPGTSGDFIPVYHLVHIQSRAVPKGRYLKFLTGDLWLVDSGNPYKKLPVARISSGNVIGTSMGYTNMFDALGVSDVINSLYSVITTHTVRWGIRPIVDFEGSGIQPSTLGNGTSSLKVKKPELMPKPLDVPDIPTDTYNQVSKMENVLVELLGMNATAMGNPPYSGMAAQAMALLDQKANEYHEGLAKSQKAYKQACATLELHILQTFAEDPRIAVIQGKAKHWMLKSFNKSDLAGVSRVAMEAAPPGTGTMAWKMALTDTLQKFGVKLAPEQVIELLRTGQMESAFEYDEANRLRIKAENEMLQRGEKPPVIMLRTHWLDIPEHMALLSSPDIAEKPEVVDAVASTIEAKVQAWLSMPPWAAALLKAPPFPGTPSEPPVQSIADGQPQLPSGPPMPEVPNPADIPPPELPVPPNQ